MIPAIAFIGRHDSGKTALIARLIPVLSAHGLRVGTVKHAPHLEMLDTPGSDSAVHFQTGASRVLLRGGHTSALFWRHGDDALRDQIDRLFADFDLVLIEGGKTEDCPKVEVFRRSADLPQEPLAGTVDVVAVITDDRIALPDGVAVISARNVEKIADLVEAVAFDAPSRG